MMKTPLTAAALFIALAAADTASAADTLVAPTTAPAPHVRLPLGEPAPEILATSTDGTPVTLASFHGKPVVLQFGSITEPLFRLRAPATERLAAKYGDKVVFLIVYERESHPADTESALDENNQDGYDIAAPTSQSERLALAKQGLTRLNIKKQQIVVDAWSNTTTLRYGNFPNMTFIIDASGKLQAGYPWMDPKKVQPALDALVAGRPILDGLRGSIHPAAPGGADYGAISMDMAGGNAGRLALVLDQMQLTDAQRAAIMPSLSQFLVDARNFRELRTGAPAQGAAAKATPATSPAKPASGEGLQTGVEKLRASAQLFKAACQANLSDKETQQIMDALDQGPARRLFVKN